MAISMPRWAARPQAVPPPERGPTPPIFRVSCAWAGLSPATISATPTAALSTFNFIDCFLRAFLRESFVGEIGRYRPGLGCSARWPGVKQGAPKWRHARYSQREKPGAGAVRQGGA